MYQNARNHTASKSASAMYFIGKRVLRLPAFSGDGAPETSRCASRAGAMMTIITKREKSVVRRASPRAAGLSRFEISQSINSTRTADRAMETENAIVANRLTDTCPRVKPRLLHLAGPFR